jgi:medium-chain acyl-[acyl-carrier-protein] hydrolase
MQPPEVAGDWLSCPRPDPRARLRLFLLPYAGGGAAAYRRWPAGLPAGVETWFVHLPGREKRFRERPFTRMGPLVEALAPRLTPLLDRPFAFFGHSMGALVGFELARHLRRAGGPPPAHLLVSGRGAPEMSSNFGHIHDLPEAAFRAQLRRLGGTPQAVLANEELMAIFSPLLRADFAVVETYAYVPGAPLDCPLSAFGGQDDPAWSADRMGAWGAHTTGPFRLHLVPGDHFFLHTAESEVVRLVGEALRDTVGRPAAVLAREGTLKTCPPFGEWQPAGEVHPLAEGEVHVWRAVLERPPEELEALYRTLSAEERERAARFHFDNHRRHFIAGRGILRALLGRYLGRDPGGLAFRYEARGKPLLAGGEALAFNLSHSHGLALYAVARGVDVGVDVERVRPEFAGEQVAGRFFSPAEVAVLRGLPPEQRQEAFFACWTRKEAYMKATGQGLSLPLDSFEVTLAPGEPAALVAARHEGAEPGRWSMCALDPGPGFAGALAVGGHGWRLVLGRWPGPQQPPPG